MPSKSPAQAKLMRIAEHTPGGYGGVPQSVGKDFRAADRAMGQYQGSLSGKQPGKRSGAHHKGTMHYKAGSHR
jgi:hypothetical protein